MRKVSMIAPLAVVALAVIFFALRPDSPAAEPEERAFDVRISDGEMSPADIEAYEVGRARLRIESEETAELSFVADITGRFDIEDHLAHGDSEDGSAGHSHSRGIGSLTVFPR